MCSSWRKPRRAPPTVYTARADAGQAKAIAATESSFTIEVRFLGGLTEVQQAAFAQAADRWARVIVGDLPEVEIDGDVIDDLLILAQGVSIDGPGRILGQAGPTHVPTAGAGASAFLPAKGAMSFDTADLAKMEEEGTLNDVITYEMGHVVGVGGLVWSLPNLLELAEEGALVTHATPIDSGIMLPTIPLELPGESLRH
ncbi:hypothetical protein [Saccharopolyspora spinosa]|uniref:Uncharacterized protein n=1 Tax=Saccharopolyspora spinosa TaxID=60894 RepID=A0A2N3Y5F7_SACSN|nr:hypothetical protein [Saccharopolyspora spinosa]PKW18159.1 hypothetical protein A8926_6224 [Saccharopolyspora spinosa]